MNNPMRSLRQQCYRYQTDVRTNHPNRIVLEMESRISLTEARNHSSAFLGTFRVEIPPPVVSGGIIVRRSTTRHMSSKLRYQHHLQLEGIRCIPCSPSRFGSNTHIEITPGRKASVNVISIFVVSLPPICLNSKAGRISSCILWY